MIMRRHLLACVLLAASASHADAQPAKRPGILAIGAGADFTCALTAQGRVLCWGRNDLGQLGRGTSDARAHPEARPVALDVPAVSLGVGYDHACVTTKDGAAYCWGDDRTFESGSDAPNDRCVELARDIWCRTRPARVRGDAAFRYVAAGFRRSCAVTKEGKPLCWGGAASAPRPRAGTSRERCADSLSANRCRPAPAPVYTPTGRHPNGLPLSAVYDTVALGSHGACGIAGRMLYCWDGAGQPEEYRGRSMPGQFGLRSVTIGLQHACGQRETSVVICWGERELGALGIGEGGALDTNTGRWVEHGPLISGFAKGPPVVGEHLFSAVTAGGLHTCAIEQNTAQLFCWGANQWGQLGLGFIDTETGRAMRRTNRDPRRIANSSSFALVAAGVDHTCGVTAASEVLCWGRTRSGATGAISPPAQSTPAPVTLERR